MSTKCSLILCRNQLSSLYHSTHWKLVQ